MKLKLGVSFHSLKLENINLVYDIFLIFAFNIKLDCKIDKNHFIYIAFYIT